MKALAEILGRRRPRATSETLNVSIPVGAAWLHGELAIPCGACGVVLFAPGPNGRHATDIEVARALRGSGIATLLFDVVPDRQIESAAYSALVTRALAEATRWLARQTFSEHLGFAFAGTGPSASAAIQASIDLSVVVDALLLFQPIGNGNPEFLGELEAPTLVIQADETPASNGCSVFQAIPSEKQLFTLAPGTRIDCEAVKALCADWIHRRVHTR